MIDDSNLLSPTIPNSQNSHNDLAIRKMQQNLIMMGFNITMINKIISFYKIRTEDEALDYLIKTDDGMWNHPFIPKEVNPEEDNNSLLEQPKAMMSNVLTRINSLGISNSINERIPSSINERISNSNIIQKSESENINNFKVIDDICEICGESKEFHKIKEFKVPNQNSNILNDDSNNNNIFESSETDINNINEEKNKLINSESNIIENNKINNKNVEEEQKEEEEDNNPNDCPICMGEFENPVEIEKCKHKFCQECLNNYLVNLINNNRIDQIPCPKNKCKNKNLSEDFFSQFLSQQEYFKYRQFRAQNEIARDSKKIFCPLCDSYASIDGITEKYDSNNPNYKKSTLKCQKGHEFCSCGRPLHENECYHDEKEFKEFLTQEKIKKCPKCGFLIKKNRGCNHMTCGNPICRYEFCWLCMKEAVPNHFDYGPCAGKQFFDPESFSYRLQQSHPFLYCIYALFKCIFVIILIIVGLFGLPGLGLSFFAYEVIYENNSFGQSLNKKYLKFLMFMNCVFVSFCLQSIIYMAWAAIFSVLALIIAILIISVIITILKGIIKCLFCSCFDNKREEHDLADNGYELENNINDNEK